MLSAMGRKMRLAMSLTASRGGAVFAGLFVNVLVEFADEFFEGPWSGCRCRRG